MVANNNYNRKRHSKHKMRTNNFSMNLIILQNFQNESIIGVYHQNNQGKGKFNKAQI